MDEHPPSLTRMATKSSRKRTKDHHHHLSHNQHVPHNATDPALLRNGPAQPPHHQHRARNGSQGGGPGEEVPSVEELRGAVFAHGNVFEAGERVVVPRSRGGFALGRISKAVHRRHCYVPAVPAGDVAKSSPAAPVSAPHQEWRVVYKNGKGEYLFKDLPPASLGKLTRKRRTSAGPPTSSKPVSILTRTNNAGTTVADGLPAAVTDESSPEARSKSPDERIADSNGGSDNSEDDDYVEDDNDEYEEVEGEVITFRGLQKRRVADQAIASDAAGQAGERLQKQGQPHKLASAATAPPQRCVGEPAIERDLAVVSFSPANTFKEGELAVVPRSAGGFTYGAVQGRHECTCPIPPAHKHYGWRVNVDQATPKANFKDVFSTHLGKLHSAEATSVSPASIIPLALTPVAAREARGAGTSSKSQRRKLKPYPQISAPATDIHRQRSSKYDFAEAGETGGRRCEPSHKNQGTEFDEYDLHYTSTPAPILPQVGSASHHQYRDEEDDEDYFEEYEDTEDLAPRPPVPTFSGLFGSPGAAPPHGDTAKAEVGGAQVSQLPQQPQEVIDKPTDAQPTEPTTRKGVLSVPNMAATVPRNKSKYRNQGQKGQARQKNKGAKPMIVLDGPNVAMRHGNNKKFSVKGLKIAIQYWERKGHQVVAFVPQHYLTRKAPTGPEVKLGEFMPMADNIGMLQDLVDSGSVVVTPPQDYDDSYSIEYGKKHDAYIVTNDRYWDHVDKQPEAARPRTIRWLREHCISFTFVKDEFLPNPDFQFLPSTTPQEEGK